MIWRASLYGLKFSFCHSLYFCTSLVISSKFFQDYYYTNHEYIKLLDYFDYDEILMSFSNKTKEEKNRGFIKMLNKAELYILKLFDYKLFETETSLQKFMNEFLVM
jgi:hypothetical protein